MRTVLAFIAALVRSVGIPIPYRAPNANAFVERFNRTLREDALDHFISLREVHWTRPKFEPTPRVHILWWRLHLSAE